MVGKKSFVEPFLKEVITEARVLVSDTLVLDRPVGTLPL